MFQNHTSPTQLSSTPAQLSPLARHERIETLDILRAIALFGIFLMNVEYFTAPLETVGRGLAPGLQGLNHAIAWFEYVFLHGKFWTMFALLFGMGFAVMDQRAARAGGVLSEGTFDAMYLRRTGVLFVIGVMHAALIWGGDILHAYAVAALVLLVILRGRWWWLLLPAAAFVPALSEFGGRLYLAGVVAFVLFAACAFYLRKGALERIWRSGVLLYCSVSVVILAMTVPGALSGAVMTDEQKTITAQSIAQAQDDLVLAASINADGSYADNVALRLDYLADNLFFDEIYLLVYATGMFLLGVWFMRSGVLRDVAAHRSFFRKLALFGIPFGAALALCSATIAVRYQPYSTDFTIASHVMMLANLPLSLGYVAALVLLIHSRRDPLRLHWLAPAGRMALSNYLVQSAIGTLLFYGYGFGLWGRIDRLGQLLLVVAVFGAQVVLSHWWLRRFNHGPAEWLWRAFTYGRYPPFVREPSAAPIPVHEAMASPAVDRSRS